MNKFINEIAPLAVKYGRLNNILPSLIIAQGILESASGSSELAMYACNLFGIKKGSGWSGEVYLKKTSEQTKDGQVFYIYAEFRKYSSYEECVIDLCKKYTTGAGSWEKFNRYEKVLGEKDFYTAAKQLFLSGYASDIKYAEKLLVRYNQYNLAKFDKEEGDNMTKVFKIGIDAGHGGYKSLNPKVYATAGKRTPDGEPEWIFNDKVVRAFTDEINKYENVEVRRFDDPTGKTDVPLATRTNEANKWGADIFISFHHNASSSTWSNATGIETFTYLGSNPQSEKLASLIHPQMIKAYGLRDRGIKKANLHIVRECHMPSILIEGGFMCSRTDILKLRDDNVLKNAGIGVANGVVQYANLKKKEVKPAPPTQQENPKQEELYWGKTLFKPNQIGRITILKPINLWKRNVEGKLEFVRILNPEEQYRVYGFDSKFGGQYDVGSNHWITKMEGYILYETPSKALLAKAKELYG